MAFRVIQHPGVSLWEGDPDCQTAHDALLTRLAAMHTSFIGVTATLDVKRKGNIGEFISLYVRHILAFDLLIVLPTMP